MCGLAWPVVTSVDTTGFRRLLLGRFHQKTLGRTVRCSVWKESSEEGRKHWAGLSEQARSSQCKGPEVHCHLLLKK